MPFVRQPAFQSGLHIDPRVTYTKTGSRTNDKHATRDASSNRKKKSGKCSLQIPIFFKIWTEIILQTK